MPNAFISSNRENTALSANTYNSRRRDAILAFLICTLSGLSSIAPVESLAAVGAAILNWFYVTLPLLILTGLGLGLIKVKYKGELLRPSIGWGFPVAMAAILLAGVIYTQGPIYGVSKALEFFFYTIPLYFLAQWILRGSFERAGNMMLCAFAVSGVFALAGLAFSQDPFALRVSRSERWLSLIKEVYLTAKN